MPEEEKKPEEVKPEEKAEQPKKPEQAAQPAKAEKPKEAKKEEKPASDSEKKETGKKISQMTLEEVEAGLKMAQEKMGGFQSGFARNLLARKKELTS